MKKCPATLLHGWDRWESIPEKRSVNVSEKREQSEQQVWKQVEKK